MKTALVTGAGRGLGLSFVKELVKRGYFVFAMLRGGSEELESLKSTHQDKIIILKGDVTDLQSIREAQAEAMAHSSKIDLLINNVGVWYDYERLPLHDENFDTEMLVDEYNINAVGPVRIVKVFLDMVKNSDMKTIINISSEAASISMHTWRNAEYAYCMSKIALNMASKIMDFTYSQDGIKVYAVDPGWIKTDMGGESAQLHPDESANDIVSLAEGDRKPYIFCNRLGEEYSY